MESVGQILSWSSAIGCFRVGRVLGWRTAPEEKKKEWGASACILSCYCRLKGIREPPSVCKGPGCLTPPLTIAWRNPCDGVFHMHRLEILSADVRWKVSRNVSQRNAVQINLHTSSTAANGKVICLRKLYLEIPILQPEHWREYYPIEHNSGRKGLGF